MSNMITELLLFASVRKEEVAAESLDMAELVNGALERLQHQIQESQAEVSLPDAYPTALGYGPWIEEVWFNYLSNALKYGGTPPRIEIGAVVDELCCRFWVRDNGAGLTAEQQSKLFIPHTRLEQHRVKGHGLGLSIVQRIVRRLGDEVGVTCEPDAGCTFSFTLPMSAAGEEVCADV